MARASISTACSSTGSTAPRCRPTGAYPQVSDWSISDPLDTRYDKFTGQWAVYAARDLIKDGETLAERGERIAGSDFDASRFGGELFELATDERGVVTVRATELMLGLVSAGRTWAMVPVISIGPFRGVRTPKSASTRPMPASHASGQEQCHALQAHGPGPRSARRWRRVCRAAPSEAFSPQSAGVTRRPQPNVNVAMVVAWHADMEKSRRLSPGPSV